MATVEKTATEELAALRERRAVAARRLREAEEEARRANATLQRAHQPVADYFVRVGRGEVEPDDAEVARLRAEVEAAHAFVGWKPAYDRGTGRVTGTQPYDVRADAVLDGAREAHQEAVQAITQFAGSNFQALAAEQAARSGRVRELMAAAVEAMVEADQAWRDVESEWSTLLRFADQEHLSESMPASPLEDGPPRPGQRVPLPMPADLVPSEEPAA